MVNQRKPEPPAPAFFPPGTVIRPAPLLFLFPAATLGASLASAAEPSPSTQSLAPPPPTPRAISPRVAEQLATTAPKYSPPVPTPAQPPATELPEGDQPRNRIIRLSPYVVRENPPPRFKERDLLTAKGRLDLALRRHPGLRLGAFGPLNNHAWAGAMLAEEFALERRQEMLDLLSLLPDGPGKPPPFPYWRPWFTTLRPSSAPGGGKIVPWERK